MQPIDLTQPVPDGIDVLWDEHGASYCRSTNDPNYWKSDFGFFEVFHVSEFRGAYCPEPPHCRTWGELIRPDTDYYAATERVHSYTRDREGVCHSDKTGTPSRVCRPTRSRRQKQRTTDTGGSECA